MTEYVFQEKRQYRKTAERRPLVMSRLLKGYTPAEIARDLGLSLRMVYRDIKFYTNQAGKTIAEVMKNREKLQLARIEIWRKAWHEYEVAEHPRDRLSALKLLHDIITQAEEYLIRSGVPSEQINEIKVRWVEHGEGNPNQIQTTPTTTSLPQKPGKV